MSEKQEIYETTADTLAENGYISEAVEMLGKGYEVQNIVKELPSRMSGFTPAPDFLIKKYGFVTALVWGRIWRYCQMRDGICRAKIETISEELGMSDRTIFRHIDPLVNDGFLKDITPDLKNRPHIYADTGKLRIRISVEAALTESQSTMTESQPHPDRESDEESIKKGIKDISRAANKKVDAILGYERQAKENKDKSWKYRQSFAFHAGILAFADQCVKRFGEPTKKDLSLWITEIGSWTDAGAIPADWKRAEEIVAGYTQPVLSITGMTKAVKFAAQERKNGRQPVEEMRPEYKKFVADPEQQKKYVPIPEHLRRKP